MSNHFPEVRDLSVCVVLPAYHAAKTLKATLDRLPNGAVQDIILVDDASTDSFFSGDIDINFLVSYGTRVVIAPAGGGADPIDVTVSPR